MTITEVLSTIRAHAFELAPDSPEAQVGLIERGLSRYSIAFDVSAEGKAMNAYANSRATATSVLDSINWARKDALDQAKQAMREHAHRHKRDAKV